MTCTVSGGTLNPTHSLTILATAGLLVLERPTLMDLGIYKVFQLVNSYTICSTHCRVYRFDDWLDHKREDYWNCHCC